METLKETKAVEVEAKNKNFREEIRGLIKGKWKLTYIIKSQEGKFMGRSIEPYKNKQGITIYPITPAKERLNRIMFDKVVTTLDPENNPQHLRYIDFMLNHPEVKTEGFQELPDGYREPKKRHDWTLVAVDYQELADVMEDDFIDKLVGRLSLEGGRGSVGIQRLRYVLSAIGLAYRDVRYVTNPDIERKILRKKLTTHVKANYKNAVEVVRILDEDMVGAEMNYQLKELRRLNILTQSNGMFKFNNVPISVSLHGVLEAWEKEPALKDEMIRALEQKL